jgi:hypothetical protein
VVFFDRLKMFGDVVDALYIGYSDHVPPSTRTIYVLAQDMDELLDRVHHLKVSEADAGRARRGQADSAAVA